FLAAAIHSGGTAQRLLMACASASRRTSSPKPSLTMLTSCLVDTGVPGAAVGDSRHVRGTAQSLQAAGSHRADAAYRHPQRCADLRIGARGVTDQHGEKLAAGGRKLGERGAERGVTFRDEDVLLDPRGIGV